MSKKTKLVAVIIALLLTALLAGSLILNVTAIRRQGKTNDEIASLKEELNASNAALSERLDDIQNAGYYSDDDDEPGEDNGQENDVRIAEDYVIRSTEHISDAYLSGNDSALSAKDKETLKMASEILDSIIEDGMTDYEKEKAVYEWMTTSLQSDTGLLPVVRDTEEDCDNPYGVLKYHNAVCVGYATTFRLFMQMMEIPCKVVHNSERYHSWDLVQLDGDWYHTDIYSDAGCANYAHFNLSDEMMIYQQDWNMDYFPAAEGYKYCYIYQNAMVEEDIYQVPAIMREALDNKTPTISLRYDSSIYEDNRVDILNTMMYQIQERVDSSSKYSYMYMDWNMYSTDSDCLLVINFTWYGDEPYDPDPSLTEEEIEKIDAAIEESFGDIPQDARYDW